MWRARTSVCSLPNAGGYKQPAGCTLWRKLLLKVCRYVHQVWCWKAWFGLQYIILEKGLFFCSEMLCIPLLCGICSMSWTLARQKEHGKPDFTTVSWFYVCLFLISFMSEICPEQNKALSSGQALKKYTGTEIFLCCWRLICILCSFSAIKWPKMWNSTSVS